MLRSLYTGIAGLQAHQQMLDVTANNIANVNTTGYKAGSIQFEDALSQTMSGSSGATGTNGGVNPSQIGLGVAVAGTATNFGQGAPQPTGVPSNLAITGDGFFAVTKNGQQLYTRAGAFNLDNAGHLVAPDGAEVQDPTGAVLDLSALNTGAYKSYNIGTDGTVNAVDASGVVTTLGQVGLATFANPNGLQKIGDSEYVPSANSGTATLGAPGAGSSGTLSSGYVEMSNVDLSQELTNLIVAERGFQANSKVITTSDEILQTLVNLKN